MDIEKIVAKLAESPEFATLVQKHAEEAVTEIVEEHGREIKRARLMEPEIAEGEWLLNPSEAHD